jgi:hypothetical protein
MIITAQIERMLDETLARLKQTGDPGVRRKLMAEMRALIAESLTGL